MLLSIPNVYCTVLYIANFVYYKNYFVYIFSEYFKFHENGNFFMFHFLTCRAHLNILNLHVPSEKAVTFSISYASSISKCRLSNKIICHLT